MTMIITMMITIIIIISTKIVHCMVRLFKLNTRG